MRSLMSKTTNRVLFSAAAAVVTVTIALPGVAQAAANHAVSGTTWSDNLRWYDSTTIRVKSGAGNVKLSFGKLPEHASGANDYIKWRYLNTSGGVIGGQYSMYSENVQYTHMALANGVQFRNSFARGTLCTSGCDHNFAGTQNY
jgi:hypothetical protein